MSEPEPVDLEEVLCRLRKPKPRTIRWYVQEGT